MSIPSVLCVLFSCALVFHITEFPFPSIGGDSRGYASQDVCGSFLHLYLKHKEIDYFSVYIIQLCLTEFGIPVK